MSDKDTKRNKIKKPASLKKKTPSLRVATLPENTNHRGDIFGGWLQSQMDLAGAAKAWEETGCNIATRFAETSFEQPIFVGDIVEFYTDIQKMGNTSVTVSMDVWALRRMKQEYVKVASGKYTYVAIDKDRKPMPIPS
jgi:acyl-CoA thioesterase YciA